MPTRFHWKFLDNDISRVYHGCELFTGIEAIIFSRLEPCRGIAARSISDIPKGKSWFFFCCKVFIFSCLCAKLFVYTIYLCNWPNRTNALNVWESQLPTARVPAGVNLRCRKAGLLTRFLRCAFPVKNQWQRVREVAQSGLKLTATGIVADSHGIPLLFPATE